MAQGDYIELHRKRNGRKFDHEEKARKKLEKHTQQTVVKTRRQTERVIAARHSADLDALAKQSKLLKRELKKVQRHRATQRAARHNRGNGPPLVALVGCEFRRFSCSSLSANSVTIAMLY